MLKIHPVNDNPDIARRTRERLAISRERAAALGRTAVEAIRTGSYETDDGSRVDWGENVRAAVEAKVSIPPDERIPAGAVPHAKEREESEEREAGEERDTVTDIYVVNDTTLAATRSLVDGGRTPLALNFANGVHPGGGFLHGARAQEEALCRSSALYATLEGDAMYTHHRARAVPDSNDWAILSPSVPVFRTDWGTALPEPWSAHFITCAAPVAAAVGVDRSAELLQQRIHRVLAIARAFRYTALVLGAWGCGAFGNDPLRTARDFRAALEHAFEGAFDTVIFAISDWSPERRFLGPFAEVFGR